MDNIYNYDLKDDDIRYYLMGKAVSNKPIDFYGKKIRQVSVDDMFEHGEKWFNSIIQPYVYNKDVYGVNDNQFGLLEVFFALSDERIKSGGVEKTHNELLKDSLSYFMDIPKKDIDILCDKNGVVQIIIGDKSNINNIAKLLFIDSNRFEELKGVILLICGGLKEFHKSDLDKKDELESKIKNNETKNRLAKLLDADKKRENDMDKSARIYNVYNSIISMNSPLDYNSALKLNIYQLYNSYNTSQIKEDNQFVLNTASNGMCSEGTKIIPFVKRIEK